MTPERIRTRLKRSRALIVAVNLARYAWLSVLNRVRPQRQVQMGARHRDFSLEQSIEYVDWVVDEYERYCGIDRDALAGARVLELGPGDNLGVAIRLLGMGASQVICLDRFHTWRDPEQQRLINAALVERMPAAERDRIAGVLGIGGQVRSSQDRLVLIEGTGAEEADRVLPPGTFDAVISRAVLMHIFDLDPAYASMDRLMRPGGIMAHKVDLSDNRLFSAAGHNPLTYLTISDWVWDRMRRYTGHSNRALIDYHRRRLAELGYEAEILAVRLIGQPDLSEPIGVERLPEELGGARPLIEEIRPNLLERYRRLPDEDLAVADVFIRARKPT